MGITVELEDKPFRGSDYPGVTDFDLIRVKITENYTGKVKLAMLTEGLTGHIGRLELDCVIGDTLHMGNKCHDLVIEEGLIYAHDLAPSKLHWDTIQIMGGYRVTFRQCVVLQRNPNWDTEGRCVFMNAGVSPPDIEDVVFERCYFEAHREPISTKSQVFTQGGSLRSGIRDSVICKAHKGPGPIWQKPAALEPVNSGNTIIPLAQPVPLHP